MRVGVAVFPGSNCDRDVLQILSSIPSLRPEFVWHKIDDLSSYDAMIVPGGFSFGDRLRAGAIAAHSPIMKEVKRLAQDGLPVLGICNGFQILVEAGLLPGALIMNQSCRFVCKWTKVSVENTQTPFTQGFDEGEEFDIPVAHGEGRYLSDAKSLEQLKRDNQIVLRYKSDDPNGSAESIAAISNRKHNVVGMMPHPERASDRLVSKYGSTRAATMFRSLAEYLAQKVLV